MKKVGKTTRPFRYDLNEIPYDYTVEVRNRLKGLDLIDRVPNELWTEQKQKILRRGGKNTQKNCTKKIITTPMVEPDILECEVKWALGSITTNKASVGDGITVELFQILKDDAVKVLHSICQQIWKTQW